ncbi:uncharacterized protein [Bemisia tabaci]|uniref:uncharacterized protein n=1 Tax=Bemisia tabaci TaxID=7038 RepID=UPI003B27F22E
MNPQCFWSFPLPHLKPIRRRFLEQIFESRGSRTAVRVYLSFTRQPRNGPPPKNHPHAHAITLIRSAIGRQGTAPPNYVLSVAIHAGGSVEQAIQILELYANIVSPRHSIAWEEERLEPWACRNAPQNNCSATCTAISTAASTTTSTAT